MKTPSPLLVTIVYYLAFVLLGLTSAAQGPSLLDLARHTSSGLDRVSLIFTAVALGYLVGSFVSGWAYDRIPGHRLMAIALLVAAGSTAFIPVAWNLWLLLGAFFLLGLGKGSVDVGGNTLLLWLHGQKVGPFMNGLHAAFGVGAFIAPLILDQVRVRTGEIHGLFWLTALLCLPVAIWLWLLPSPTATKYDIPEKKTTFPIIPVAILITLFISYVGLELGFANWVYAYALNLKLATESSGAYLTSAFWGAFTVGRLLGIWTALRMRSTTILFMDLAGCIISALIILLWRDSVLALWVGTIGLGLCMASIFATVLMLAGERIRVTGTITGLFLVGSALGSATIPALIGQAFAHIGPHIMPIIILVDVLIFLLVLVYFISQRIGLKPADA